MTQAFPEDEPYVRLGDCQHPSISDVDLAERQDLQRETYGVWGPLVCPDCFEYLYPHDSGLGGPITVYTEPYGVGED